MHTQELLKHFLPEGILDYFELIEIKDSTAKLTLVLEEKPIQPDELSGRKLHSKGFYPVVAIQDFPVRKKACFLQVKRRRWIDVDTSEVFSRDWNLVAKGTRMTEEFALFLKRLVR